MAAFLLGLFLGIPCTIFVCVAASWYCRFKIEQHQAVQKIKYDIHLRTNQDATPISAINATIRTLCGVLHNKEIIKSLLVEVQKILTNVLEANEIDSLKDFEILDLSFTSFSPLITDAQLVEVPNTDNTLRLFFATSGKINLSIKGVYNFKAFSVGFGSIPFEVEAALSNIKACVDIMTLPSSEDTILPTMTMRFPTAPSLDSRWSVSLGANKGFKDKHIISSLLDSVLGLVLNSACETEHTLTQNINVEVLMNAAQQAVEVADPVKEELY